MVTSRNWSPEHLDTNFVAIGGPPDQVWQTVVATDSPALPQVVPYTFHAYTQLMVAICAYVNLSIARPLLWFGYVRLK